jgi:hypothetical protein
MSEVAFETENYIGSDIAQFGPGGERPSRSAKLVASLQWPERISSYLLTTNRARSGWCLWEQGFNPDTGNPLYIRVAFGTPYHGISAKVAAERLLIEAWRGEREQWGTVLSPAYVEHEGLLRVQDIRRVEDEVAQEAPAKPDKTDEIAFSQPRWVMYNLAATSMKAHVPPTPPFPPGTKEGRPESFGWMRRTDLDKRDPEVQIWEAADGALYEHKPRDGQLWLVKFPSSSKANKRG